MELLSDVRNVVHANCLRSEGVKEVWAKQNFGILLMELQLIVTPTFLNIFIQYFAIKC